MRTKLKLLLLLAAAVTGLGQGESEPYFALSSSRTFPSGGKPTVSMSAWRVDALEFRVYRVNDPLQFIRQLEDAHRFGMETPQPPRERTTLEKVHRWKNSLRASIRRGLRGQFTESPRAHLGVKDNETAPAVPAAKGTKYAEAPLLNSQQLVLSFVQPVQSKTRWDRQEVPLDVKDKGVYLVEAVKGELRAYTILIVSDLVMITKTGSSRIFNAVVDRKTGQPIPNVQISAFARDGKPVEATTDQNGIAEMKPSGVDGTELRLVAHSGRAFAVNTMPGGGIQESSLWMGYLYTDRPIYRPGHKVNLKGILRVRKANGFEVPAGKSVSVEIQDPDQKPVYQKTLTTSANGTVRDEFTLESGAALGHYFIQMKSGDAFMSGNFDVEEYKKPEYEVRVTAAPNRVLQGQPATAVVDARYFFGEPVSGAQVKYAVYRERYWFPLWYDPDDEVAEGEGGGPEEDDAGDQMEEKEGRLDAEGKMTIPVETTVSDNKFDYRYRIEARVTDAGNREITGKGYVLATYGSFVLNVSPDRYVFGARDKATAKIEARDYDNKPVKTRARVELLKWNYRQPEESELKGAVDVDLATGEGMARLDIPAQSGGYVIRATAKGAEGRDIQATSHIWVEGTGKWDERPSDRNVQILTDQKTYRAGQTAKLVILAGQDNTAVYVTVEGRDLRQYKLIRSKGSTVSFEVPLTANDEPGITVSAGFVRDGVFHNGGKYIKVPPVEHQLNVKLTTDKPQYLPGQTAEYSIEATTADGRPAPRAEFSLGVVDEAIYSIRRDSTRDILSFFFDRDWNRVYTDSSLEYYFTGEAGKRRMRLAELRPASRLAQLKPERMVEPKIRKAFPDTAFWAADVVTDGAGKARAKVEFPDSLTTWRATARGITPDTKAGGATLKTLVRKNLILRLVVPRFFIQGDEVVISALVHNYLQDAKTARVSLDVEGLEVLEGATKEVQIASRGEAKVDWRVRAKNVRGAKVTGKALTNEESDALELELPVNLPGLKMAEARGGSVAAGGTAAFELTYPANVVPGSRAMAIHVSPSIAGALFGALEYLITFPYGCVEQTMSSFLPNVVVKQAVQELGLKVQMDNAGLQEKIRAGLERLYAFQHEDGGWGWWQTDESHPFMTAYVVAGLVQAKQAGVAVKDDAVQKGLDWVKKDFAADPKLAGDLRAYMVYSMAVAGAPDAAAIGQVYERRSTLSPYGLAILGLALDAVKDARTAEIVAALEKGAQQDQEQAWWPATRDQMLDFSEDVTPEATAFAAKFLSRQKRDSALLPKAAQWLMNHRNEGYWWSSTKQTAMVIYGLTDYLKTTNELKPNFTATVLVNDQPVWTKKIDQAGTLNIPAILLDESKQQAGTNRVRITTSGEGRLYYSGRAEYYSRDEKLQKSGTVALNLLRDYFRLSPGKEGDRIVWETTPLNGPVAAGDIVAVRLTVTGSEWKYVMVEDPIPAGTEFIPGDNVYEIRNRPPWWAYTFTRREMHDDRMAIFQTYMPQGQQQYFYLLKVVNPGAFQVNPARVGPMYQPDVMATSESRRLEVK